MAQVHLRSSGGRRAGAPQRAGSLGTHVRQDVLHASANESTLLLAWFGVFGLIGSVVLGRLIDRADAPVAATAMVGPDGGFLPRLAVRCG